ncbi:MAG TPA: MFS transporter [Pyrinomonadaceae bacterium]|jgi:MFS family permease
MATLTYRKLLRDNRSFRRLLSGQVVSELGNWFNFIAVLGLVRTVSLGAPEATAVLIVLRLAPFALFAPIAGAFADRWSRRALMIGSDLARAVFALGFLLVRGPEDIWIAYVCTAISTLLAAFFEAAKNASMPNITGGQGLLAGNALMFSTRFLLMSLGAALGGAASARFGYEAAFIINALSFLVSAYSIWLIPEHAMREADDEAKAGPVEGRGRVRVWSDMREAWAYIMEHRVVAALLGLNILWATGGGALNLIYDRLGGVVFAERGGLKGDAGVAALYTAAGAGLFVGMLLARRAGAHVELHGKTAPFIGWMIFAHGLLLALAGLMPTLWLVGLMFFLSRVVIGIEFAIQDTLLMRLLPDNLRGRVITTDRAAEISVMSMTTVFYGWMLHSITPQTLTIISGLLSASPGIIWLLLLLAGKLRLPAQKEAQEATPEREEDAALASTV